MTTAPSSIRITAEQATAVVPRAPSMLRRLVALTTRPTSRQGFLALFDQGVYSATTFFTSIIIARTLTPGELGLFFLVGSIILFIVSIQGSLIISPYTIYCGRFHGRTLASYTGSTVLQVSALTAVGVFGMLVYLASLVLLEPSSPLIPTILVVLGVLPLLILRHFLRQMLFAHLQLMAAIWIDVLVAAIQLGGLLLLASIDRLTVPTSYMVMGVASAVAGLCWFVSKRQAIRIRRALVVLHTIRNWRFGRWCMAGHMVGTIGTYFTPWVLVICHGDFATGIYAACISLGGVANMFINGVGNYLTPKASRAYSRGGESELLKVLWIAVAVFTVFLGCVAVTFAIAGDQLGTSLFGDQYGGLGLILVVLTLACWFQSVGLVVGNGLWAIERPRANFSADVVNCVVTVAATLILVPVLGVIGTVFTGVAACSLSALVRTVALHRSLREASPASPVT